MGGICDIIFHLKHSFSFFLVTSSYCTVTNLYISFSIILLLLHGAPI